MDTIDLSNCTVTGRATSINGMEISVYPNPVASVLHIDGLSSSAMITIYDSINVMILQVRVTSQINLSSLKMGVSYLQLSGDTQIMWTKLMKE